VAQLTIEPPPETPLEVDRELAALDDQAMRTQARLGALAMVAYFVFFPIMFVAGFREVWFMIAGPAVAAATLGVTLLLTRRPLMWMIHASFVGHALLVGIVARVLSPFLVAPGLGVIIVMVYAMHPRVGRGWVLWASLVAAVLLPWIGELAGVVSQTTLVTEHGLVLRVAAERLDVPIVTVALGLYALVILAVATTLSRALAASRVAMQRSLHVQAWQLRQLVPRGGLTAESFVTMPRATRPSTSSF